MRKKNKKIHPKSNDKVPRLVFELEYLESLPEYEKIRLNIHHTYTDTFLGRVVK